MLFVDMIYVRWRHGGKKGRIIVRGTDNILLFTCSPLLPPACHKKAPEGEESQPTTPVSRLPPSHDAEDDGLSCYYHAYYNRKPTVGPLGAATPAPEQHTTTVHAISVGLDAKQHPNVRVLYQEVFSKHEDMVATVDISYNTRRFKNGFFADSVMQKHGYGVLLLCHASPEARAGPSNITLTHPPVHFVNWRQCRCLIKSHVRSAEREAGPEMIETAGAADGTADTAAPPLTAPAHERAQNTADHDNDEHTSPLAVDPQWDSSLYRSLKQTVCSTFNIF